ncbi:HAD-IA family hydrolase [Streptobacillus moniliformis]|uniref:HAD-IA family hydrolase n=1 Tax=Streptobacillus moniliformis TaxID=34105 RepID=UPI0007E3D1A7|nr:HAD-IA family hydrolase [Streptobacillus moniliformis]QXW65095.1 HAD-IA family hydrolase [Streptobacillus moniliformis]
MMKKIVCVDSDGCVMDTMNYKHIECFGPIAADFWNIEEREEFLTLWNHINLYSKTRGINRFHGLNEIFKIFSEKYPKYTKLNEVDNWIKTTSELSNNSLIKEIEITDSKELKKALNWSLEVNKKIVSLEGMDKPFDMVKEAFEVMKNKVKIVIVSSANKEAILSEWERHGLLKYVDIVMGQDTGSKKDCIKKILIDNDLDVNDVLMIGDSPGDITAAKDNGIHFYPIIFDDESKSWARFKDKILDEFINNQYDDQKYIDEYNKKL